MERRGSGPLARPGGDGAAELVSRSPLASERGLFQAPGHLGGIEQCGEPENPSTLLVTHRADSSPCAPAALPTPQAPFGKSSISTAKQLRVALWLDRVLSIDPAERSSSDLDTCAQHVIALEKSQKGSFFQHIMFNTNVQDDSNDQFAFERCTLLFKHIPERVEDYVAELLKPFGTVLQVSLRRKRGNKGDQKHRSWALVTFTHAGSVASVLNTASTDPEGRVELKGNHYANVRKDEVVRLLPSVVDAHEAVNTKGSFGETWQAARKKAQENLGALRFLSASSNYRPDVIQHMRIRWVQKGFVLWEEGDLSDDCFYFLVAGCLDVTSRGPTGTVNATSTERTVISQLYSGSTFGDMAVLGDFNTNLGKRSAGIRAASDVVVLLLDRLDYLRLTGEYTKKAVEALRQDPAVRNSSEHSILKNVFAGCGLYGSSRSSTFSDRIARVATHVHVKKNETLFKQDDDAETFYIVVNGYVRVIADGELVGCLGPGSMFGEAGLTGETAAQRKRTATIIGGFIIGTEGAPTDEMLAKEKDLSRRRRAMQLGPSATGRVYEHADLAAVHRDDFLKITAGTTDAIKAALGTKGSERTEEQLDLLFELLRDTKFFQFLRTPAVQKRACQVLQLRVCERDEILFEEGEIEDTPLFYILVHGKVEGRARGKGAFILEAGAGFGEIAVIAETVQQQQRTATMKCNTDAVFATLSQPNYLEITSGLEDQVLASLCVTPSARTQKEIEILLRYFEQNHFFKMVGYSTMQTELLKGMTVRPVARRTLPSASLAGDEGLDGVEETVTGAQGAGEGDVRYGDLVSRPLCRQFEATEGSIFFVMRGTLTVLQTTDGSDGATSPKSSVGPSPRSTIDEIDQAGANEAEVTRYSIGCTFCNILPDGELPNVPIPGHDPPELVMENQSTVYALRPQTESTDSTAVIVGPIPKNWTTHELYEQFKPVGDIAKISFISSGIIARRRGRWAQIVFVTVTAAQQATRQSFYAEDADKLARADLPSESSTLLKVELDQTAKQRPSGMNTSTAEAFDMLMAADAVVAELALPIFNKTCVEYLTHVFHILSLPPKERTLPMLATLKDFLAPTEFMQGIQSSMIRRNTARYMSLLSVEPGERLYKYGAPISGIYIVLHGSCALEAMTGEPDQKGIGTTLQGPASLPTLEEMETEGPGVYAATATAIGDTPLVVAQISTQDYLRTSSLEGMQKIIDMYFQLGVDFQQSKASQRRQAAEQAATESGRGGRGSITLEDTEEYNRVLRFAGYKQVYMRIGKSLASNGRYSQAELTECMKGDWQQDLEEFGDVELAKNLTKDQARAANMLDAFDQTEEHHQELLTREQYTQSLYQLIDEWSGSVESTQLYEHILQLILDNSSTVASEASKAGARGKKKHKSNTQALETDTSELKPGDPGYLALKPLRQVECIFQQLADSRVLFQKRTRRDRVLSEVGQDVSSPTSIAKLKKMGGVASSHLSSMVKVDKNASEAEIQSKLAVAFKAVDADGSGLLDKNEVAQLAASAGKHLSAIELDAAMAEMDEDNSGEVSFDEFAQWYKRMAEDDDMLREVFNQVDTDGSGALNRWELETVLIEMGEQVTREELNAAMRMMDDDNSGEVCFDEFKAWWNHYQSEKTTQRLIQQDPVRKYRYTQFMHAQPNAEGELGRHKVAWLMKTLGRDVTTTELDWLMVIVDTDNSDTVSFDEFEQCYALITESDLSLDAFFEALLPDDDDGSMVIPSETIVSAVKRLCIMHDISSTDEPHVQEFLQKHSQVGIGSEAFKEWWGHFKLTCNIGDDAGGGLGDATFASTEAADIDDGFDEFGPEYVDCLCCLTMKRRPHSVYYKRYTIVLTFIVLVVCIGPRPSRRYICRCT